jgi:multidrug efflux pump subunit AcrA (membrane-fusion protein)
MKKSFISFIHSPSKVIAVSLVIALAVGTYGYLRINKKETYAFTTAGEGVIVDNGTHGARNVSLGFLVGGRVKSVTVAPGDTVKKGQQLATLDAGNTLGVVTQAKANLSQAQANYAKIVNGATGPTIDVARSQVHTAQVNLSEAQRGQDILVANAKRILLNSTIAAENESTVKAPSISGTYTGTDEGIITLTAYPTTANGYFVLSGLATGTGKISTTDPQPLGSTGLSIVFPQGTIPSGTSWTIALPNTKAPNYLTNYNAYQSALQTRTQTLATLQAAVEQASASLTALVTAARPEDVAQAQAQVSQAEGAVQIAEAAYQNTVITAPYDGTISSVSITIGQIAQPNAPLIELDVKGTAVTVPIMVPQSAVISSDGKDFVVKKNGTETIEQEVTLGISDENNVEIKSGLSSGDEVVIH